MKKRKKKRCSIFVRTGRITFVSIIVTSLFCAIIGRLFYLHVINREATLKETEEKRSYFVKLEARRGDITDCRGNLLATSIPLLSIGVDPETFNAKLAIEKENIAKGNIRLDKDGKTYVTKKGKPYVLIEERLRQAVPLLNIDYDKLYKLSTLKNGSRWIKFLDTNDNNLYDEQIRSLQIPGVYANRKYIRTYPSGSLMSHVVGYLGYVDKKFGPVMGAEAQFEYYLRGQDGWIESERAANQREASQFRTREYAPTDGMNVELSLDLNIQEMAQREIIKIVENHRPEKATIIVSEAMTGYVLAMVNYPNFDPNHHNKYSDEDRRNFAISDNYEPGSTFKIVTVSSAFNESIIGPEDKFDCDKATVDYKGKKLYLPGEAHPMGILTVREIIKHSSNKGASQIGVRLDKERLYNYALLFGFSKKTEIGLPAEAKGSLRNPKKWDNVTFTRIPIGHGISATPLQIHCAMSVIANNGAYMRPQIVKRAYFKDGKKEIPYSPYKERDVINPKVARLMTEIMSEVTEGGTANKAAVKGFKVAGKTGTSQKLAGKGYTRKAHIASFSGFFPAQRPRLIITIVADNPKTTGLASGGKVCAPAFKNIAEQAANYLGIQTDEEYEKIVAWKGIK